MRISSLPVVLATLLGLSGGKLAAQPTPGEGDRAPSLALFPTGDGLVLAMTPSRTLSRDQAIRSLERSVFGVVKNGRAQTSLPVFDMHLHAQAADSPPVELCPPFENLPVWDPAEEYSWEIMLEAYVDPACENPLESPATDEGVMRGTISAMQRHNVFGVLSGSPERVAAWRAVAPNRFIPGIVFDPVDDPEITPDSLRHLVETGKVAVFGEITGQYEGLAPNDERMEPYWALAEELDIPVAIHMGKAAPGVFYMGDSGYRGRLSSALLLEEVLVRHPRLRVYIMHAGYPRLDDLLTLLYDHPQVYVDIGAFWSEPRAGFYRYLEAIVDAGFGKRVMYGSDQIVWPGAIELTIDAIEEAPFLSPAQRRDILYNNAARFLRLSEEDIARHHGR